ncbi:Hypothetical protein CAP_0713 [Chondromyces apiculatus DSM 436]|uniref:Uncharacterized protein n=1 Tax=Chondromyces apiculatus DSM 436 TaxID=1192034 RepID=A0A017TDB6_9BACT|nr:Hypothetical protein CAP_0713 [Chondromyces apiculatus DSM 436]
MHAAHVAHAAAGDASEILVAIAERDAARTRCASHAVGGPRFGRSRRCTRCRRSR